MTTATTPARHTPRTRRRWLVTAAAALGVLLTARLGWWQLDRAAQKTALAEAIERRATLPPLDADHLPRSAAQADEELQRPVRLRGRWLVQHTVFLDNRAQRGRAGFIVVTPLLLAPGDAVLVQRGWAPRDFVDRTRLPVVPSAAGEVTVSGRISWPPSPLMAFGDDGAGVLRQNLQIAAFAREIGTALRPLSIQQTAESGPPDGLQRDWALPPSDVGKHRGYAAQWFALAALIAGLYLWFNVIQPRRHAPPL